MRAQYNLFFVLCVALLASSCAIYSASPMPNIADAKTPAERTLVAYGELTTVSDTVNSLIASGMVISKAKRNEIADTIDKLTMVVDLYALSQVKDLTVANRLKLKSRFTKDVRLYDLALEIYNGYENTADGQLRALLMVNTLTIELIQQLEGK